MYIYVYIYSYGRDVRLDAQASLLVSGAPAQRSGPHTSQSCCTRAMGSGCLTAAKTALRQAEAGCRSVRADASFERTLRSSRRFVRADAPFARTLLSIGHRATLRGAERLLSASARTERPRQRSVHANEASAGVGHSEDSGVCT